MHAGLPRLFEKDEKMTSREEIDALFAPIAAGAKRASRILRTASTRQKNAALLALADQIEKHAARIAHANAEDLAAARAAGLSPAFLDRLDVTDKVLREMAQGCRKVAELPDPVGSIEKMAVQDCGIFLGKMRVPLGVLGIIYESRPNVTVDAAALAIKSGNAAILRGGSEAIRTNTVLAELVASALKTAGLPEQSVQVAPTTDRAFVGAMITANGMIDVIIPRGGKSLVARLQKEATVPMIAHLDGICHTYIDEDADIAMAVSIADNAKTQRYSPCNTTETLLVHDMVAREFLPQIGKIYAEKGVEMRCDPVSKSILAGAGLPTVEATEQDWDTEYNAPIISIHVVSSVDEAIDFIEAHGSHHTDAIVSQNHAICERFLREVDSGSVMVNCSTRLADGQVYGLGAEIGISTGKLHVRGPVGLEGLTNLKYIVLGHGEGRQ